MYTTLITAEQVIQLQNAKAPLMVFDCSFDLSRSEAGGEMFAQSHIAGAVFADLDRTLSAKGDRQRTGAPPFTCARNSRTLAARCGFYAGHAGRRL